MKGPGLRIDLDVRRIWRCAKCGKTARTAGHVVAYRCGCSEESPWMALQVAPRREPFRPPLREPLPEPADEEPAAVEPRVEIEQPGAAAPALIERPATETIPVPAEVPADGVSTLAPQAAPAAPPAEEFGAGLDADSSGQPA